MPHRSKRLFIYYVLGALTVLVGVILLLTYVFTFILNQHKPFFENQLSHILHSPVKIEKIEASHHGLRTHVALKNVAVMGGQSQHPLFRLDRLYIQLSPLPYLFSGGSFKSSPLELLGADVVIEKKKSGDIYFQQFLLPTQPWKRFGVISGNISQSPIVQWLMKESHLSLRNVNFKFQENHVTLSTIHLVRLDLTNVENGHVLTGEIRLGDDDHTAVQFYLFLNHPKPIWMKGFLAFHDVNLMEWKPLIQKVLPSSQTTQGILNGKIWWEWEEGQWKSVKGHLQGQSLKWQVANHYRLLSAIDLDQVQGNWAWTKTPVGWVLGGDHIQLKTKDYLWPENQFFLGIEEGQGGKKPGKQVAWIQYLSIQDVFSLLKSNPWLVSKVIPASWALWLDKDIQGDLNDVTIQHVGRGIHDSPYRVNASFSQVHIPVLSHTPEISGLSGAVVFNQNEGRITLNSKDTWFDFGSLFPQPLFFSQLKSQLHWQLFGDHRWRVNIEDTQLINAEMALDAEGAVENMSNATLPTVRILAGAEVENASSVKHYFPVGIFKPALIAWLNQAFVSSGPLTATTLIQGSLHDFPFDHNTGTFIVDIPVKNLDFQYAPDWPMIHGFNGHLVFSGRSMSAEANAGQIAGVSIHSATGTIPYIGEEHPLMLNVEGKVKGDAQSLIDFYRQSPLHEWSRTDLAGIRLSGSSSLQLSMRLPIETPEKTTLKGLLNWDKVGLHIKPWALVVSDLTGHIGFTEKTITSRDLTGKWMNQNLPITIQTVTQNHQPVTQIRFTGNLSSSLLQQKLSKSFPFLSGVIPYQGLYEGHLSKQDKAPDHISVSSTLKGTQIALPAPFGKKANEVWPAFKASIYLGQSPGDQKVLLTAKDRWSLGLWIRQNNIWSGHLSLGDRNATVKTEKGWWIDGVLNQFHWNDWKSYLEKADSDSSESMMKKLKGVNLWVRETEIGGRTFDPMRVQLTPYVSQWLCELSGKTMEGKVWFPWPIDRQLVRAEFKHLYLSPSKEKNSSFDVSRIPPFKLSVNDFYYKNHSYGQLNVETHTVGHRLNIDHLDVASVLLNAHLKGFWEQDSRDLNKNRSGLSGELSTGYLTSVLENAGINFGLKGSHAQATIDLRWPSSLNDMLWSAMNGSLDIRLGKGQIMADAKNSSAMLNAGFIISLLSVRRIINMDFSDLGQQGYSFDVMRGRLLLDGHGVMSLDQLYFDGPIAKIYVSGRAYLIKKFLDLNVTVRPYITSSLPLLAAFAINPIAGGVTFVADKLIGKEVSKMSEYLYKVTGPWSDPKLVERTAA